MDYFGLVFGPAGAGDVLTFLVGALIFGWIAGGAVALLASAGPRR